MRYLLYSTMLSKNLSASVEGKLKELPLEARHSICLELSKKRRQSVASSIFIPKEATEKLRPTKAQQNSEKTAVPPQSIKIRKTISLANYRKLSKLERKKKYRQYKLAKDLKMRKQKVPSTPVPSLRHPESFPIVRQTVTSEHVRHIVESLRDGKDGELQTNSTDETSDVCVKATVTSTSDVTPNAENKQEQAKDLETTNKTQTALAADCFKCCATLATEPYVITVDLSGLQLDANCCSFPSTQNTLMEVDSTVQYSEMKTVKKPKAKAEKCKVIECRQVACNNDIAINKQYEHVDNAKSQQQLLQDLSHTNKQTNVSNVVHYKQDNNTQYSHTTQPTQRMNAAVVENRMHEQVIDLTCATAYKTATTVPPAPVPAPAQPHYQSLKQRLLAHKQKPPPSIPEKPITAAPKIHAYTQPPIDSALSPITPPAHNSQTYSVHKQQYAAAAKRSRDNNPAQWFGYIVQTEQPYYAMPTQTTSAYPRNEAAPFETPPISPQEPQWPPPARVANVPDYAASGDWQCTEERNAGAACVEQVLPHMRNINPYARYYSMPPHMYPPTVFHNAPTGFPNMWPYAEPANHPFYFNQHKNSTHQMPAYPMSPPFVAPPYERQPPYLPNLYGAPLAAYNRPMELAPPIPAQYTETYANLPSHRHNVHTPPAHYRHIAAFHPYTVQQHKAELNYTPALQAYAMEMFKSRVKTHFSVERSNR